MINSMRTENKDVFVNFRVDKSLQSILDLRAKERGVSRADIARQFFKLGAKLPIDVPKTFGLLLYQRTLSITDNTEIREEAIRIIKEIFE